MKSCDPWWSQKGRSPSRVTNLITADKPVDLAAMQSTVRAEHCADV
jgi:hypothetical protein